MGGLATCAQLRLTSFVLLTINVADSQLRFISCGMFEHFNSFSLSVFPFAFLNILDFLVVRLSITCMGWAICIYQRWSFLIQYRTLSHQGNLIVLVCKIRIWISWLAWLMISRLFFPLFSEPDAHNYVIIVNDVWFFILGRPKLWCVFKFTSLDILDNSSWLDMSIS